MESRDQCGSLGLGLVARGEELILFSSGDKCLGALTMSRHRVSVTGSMVRRTVFKVQYRRHCGVRCQEAGTVCASLQPA